MSENIIWKILFTGLKRNVFNEYVRFIYVAHRVFPYLISCSRQIFDFPREKHAWDKRKKAEKFRSQKLKVQLKIFAKRTKRANLVMVMANVIMSGFVEKWPRTRVSRHWLFLECIFGCSTMPSSSSQSRLRGILPGMGDDRITTRKVGILVPLRTAGRVGCC